METIWSDFLNSRSGDWRGGTGPQERMDWEKWQHYFLERWGLSAPIPASSESLKELLAFREQLRMMVHRYVLGEPVSERDLESLNPVLADGPVIRQAILREGVILTEEVPLRSDWRQIRAEVAASFVRTLKEGEPSRIRICDNPDCGWIFYDDTRNRTKKYCEDKTCGNLMKVRRFRAKKKEQKL